MELKVMAHYQFKNQAQILKINYTTINIKIDEKKLYEIIY